MKPQYAGKTPFGVKVARVFLALFTLGLIVVWLGTAAGLRIPPAFGSLSVIGMIVSFCVGELMGWDDPPQRN